MNEISVAVYIGLQLESGDE